MMWWPFSSKKSIGEAGIMSGLTDWHSHLLPGVDDGVRLVRETRQVLARCAAEGVRRLWLTPHVMEDVPNTPAALKRRFAEVFGLPEDEVLASRVPPRALWRCVQSSACPETPAASANPNLSGITAASDVPGFSAGSDASGASGAASDDTGSPDAEGAEIEVRLAAENMLDNLFDDRLAAGEVLPIGRDGDHLLVETSYFNPPSDFTDKLRRTLAAGFYPVLAHPERYVYMEQKHYRRLLDMGVKFQLNLYSLAGLYGKAAAEKARRLLADGCYTLVGTDTHRYSQLDKALGAKVLSSSTLRALERLKENNSI